MATQTTIAAALQDKIDAKAAIKAAIENKGGTVPANSLLSNYSLYISSLFDNIVKIGYYKVRFYSRGILIKEQWVLSGTNATPPTTPTDPDGILIFDGWAGVYTNITKDTDLGALWRTVDGYTYIFVSLEELEFSMDIGSFGIDDGYGSGIRVIWGDGVEEDYEGYVDYLYHTYSELNIVCIKVKPLQSNEFLRLNGTTTSYNTDWIKIYAGNQLMNFTDWGFYQHYYLQEITIHGNFGAIVSENALLANSYVFQSCKSLKYLYMPGAVKLGINMLGSCTDLQQAIFNEIISIGNSAISACYNLKVFSYAQNTISTVGTNLFSNNYQLRLTTYLNLSVACSNIFSNCYSLDRITIPSSVTVIGGSAFSNCQGNRVIIVMSNTPPTILSTTFTGIHQNCKIYVPDARVAVYKAATNWIVYTNQIYPISAMS